MPKARGPKPTHPRTCERCEKVFPAAKASARFCSIECTRAATGYGRNYGSYEPREVALRKPASS